MSIAQASHRAYGRVAAVATLALVGCGGSHHAPGTAAAATSGATKAHAGFVPDPAGVPASLERHGLMVKYRKGPPPPTGFVRTFYGTAENGNHVRINFGILIAREPGAERFYGPQMLRLVPGAKRGDAAVGIGFVTITTQNPKTRDYSRRRREEYEVAGDVRFAVADLAPKAANVEGP